MSTLISSLSLFSATLLITLSAHAVVQPAGTFVATQCGPQTIDVARAETHVMVSGCIGQIVGSPERAVRFILSDESAHTFKVVGQQNLMMALASGATMSVYRLVGENGEELAMKVIISQDGTVKSFSGEFQTNSYLVPSLQTMFTIM